GLFGKGALMSRLPVLLRAAVRLADVYSTRGTKAVETALSERLAIYERRRSFLGQALRDPAAAGSETPPGSLRRHLRGLVHAVEQAVGPTLSHREEEIRRVPDLRSLLAELRQLEDEFGALQVDLRKGHLRVETERIVLGGVDLGPFAIELSWSALQKKA